MENRYYYLDRDGQVQGPVWLSVMRDLWRKGRFMMSTEISLNGADGWQPMEFDPEIFDVVARVPALKRMAQTKSNPVRLLVWTILLFLAYATWVIVHWDEGMLLKFGEVWLPRAAGV